MTPPTILRLFVEIEKKSKIALPRKANKSIIINAVKTALIATCLACEEFIADVREVNTGITPSGFTMVKRLVKANNA